MRSETDKVTIRLPRQNIAFAKAYAKAHGLTLTEVIDRHLRHLRAQEQQVLSPELDAITGVVPPEVDIEGEYRSHVMRKHAR